MFYFAIPNETNKKKRVAIPNDICGTQARLLDVIDNAGPDAHMDQSSSCTQINAYGCGVLPQKILVWVTSLKYFLVSAVLCFPGIFCCF